MVRSTSTILMLVLSFPVSAATPDTRIDRLAHLGRLWGVVRYQHPGLAYLEVDWDAALIAAISRTSTAETSAEYRVAVQAMLDVLDDPVTRVLDPAQPPPQVRAAEFLRRHQDVLVINLAPFVSSVDPGSASVAFQSSRAEIDAAKAIVVDLRRSGNGVTSKAFAFILDELAPSLASRRCQSPPQRHVLHDGYRPQRGTTSGGYSSAFVTKFGSIFEPRPGGVKKKVVFLVDRQTWIPPLALALRTAGDARIASVGSIGLKIKPNSGGAGSSPLLRFENQTELRRYGVIPLVAV